VRWSLIEANHDLGVQIEGSDATLEGCVIRDMEPDGDGAFGRGLNVQLGPTTGAPSNVTVRASIVERALETGIEVLSSSVTLEGVVVRASRPRAIDQVGGTGIEIGRHLEAPERAMVVLRGCVIESCFDRGIAVFASEATLDRTLIRDIAPDVKTTGLGDGVVFVGDPVSATGSVVQSRIENAARAAISSFGSHVAVESTVLECNPIDLDGEIYLRSSFEFEDKGDNVCSCAGASVACVVLSSNITPPTPFPSAP
jgi:hypothetical protein